MALRPKHYSNQSDSDLEAEETLSLDRARWSGFRDGLGERENGVDEQGFSIELLRLRKEFSPFALPLSDRILRLIDFDRPGATRALRIERDEISPRLILVSERAPGFRLSKLLERGLERGVIPDLGAALYIMRRLLATAAALHRTTGVGHLAIAPERILITPRGAVVLVETAIAGALEAFDDRMPPALREGLRTHRLDASAGPHADIARITIAGMAMIVGRPIDPSEDIDPLSPVVQEVVEVAAVRAGDPFAAALTPWLDRAISVDPLLGYEDFADASADLEEIVPPADARCSISRAPLRKFLDDLSIGRGHLQSAEEDRLREIRARQIRRGIVVPVDFDLMSAAVAAPASDEFEDPASAIMDMPVAVEDLSSEIFKQPVVIDDQPSAMAAFMNQVAPSDESDEQDIPAELDEAVQFEVVDASEEAVAAPDLVSFENETPSTDEVFTLDEAEPVEAEPTLDDLVNEILRRGVEPELPEAPAADELLTEFPDTASALFEDPAPAVFEDAPSDPPVDEPTIDEPPIHDPVTEEPPAEEPPAYEPPVQDPPPDEPPADEPPPIWLRAAIEQVARTRQDRPASPPPRRAQMRGPVFELPDDPEPESARELEPETTTLSDIAKELGLSIPAPDPKTERWARPAPEPEPEPEEDEAGWEEPAVAAVAPAPIAPAPQVVVAPPPVASTAPVFAPPPPAYQPPVYQPPPYQPPPYEPPPPVFEPLPSRPIESETFTPLPPPVALERLAPVEATPPAPVVFEAAAPAPRRSIAERTAELRESSGPFLKLAATLVLVVGGLAAAGYGGWRYYSSLTTPGMLVVESSPPGSQVEIDGTQRGTTPLTLELPPGSHEVALTRRGITRRFSVSVTPGEQTSQTLDWSQVRETGSLAVSTEPAGAKVSVDGRAYGVTPLTVPDLPAGRRRVLLEGQGGTVSREVTIEADRTATLSEAIFSGFLAVFAPVELQIFVGGKLLGTTENSRIMIPAGRHELTLVNRELGARMSRTVNVEPGQVAAINITEVPVAAQPAAPPAAPPAADAVQPAADPQPAPQN